MPARVDACLQGDKPLCGECNELFEVYAVFCERKDYRKVVCWPVMIR